MPVTYYKTRKGRAVYRTRDEARAKSKKSIVKKAVEAEVMRSAETKTTPIVVVGAPADDFGLTLLNGLSQGTTPTTRVGSKIVMTAINIKGIITIATQTQEWLSIHLIYDKAPQGTAISKGNIFDLTGLDRHTPYGGPFRNVQINMDRYKILKTWDIYLDGDSKDGKNCRRIDYYKKVKLPVQYSTGNLGTISDIYGGSLYLAICAETDFASLSVSIGSRINFKDS